MLFSALSTIEVHSNNRCLFFASIIGIAAGLNVPFDLTKCHFVFLDIGTNVGVHVRKLFEPEKYIGAQILPYYNRVFGQDRRRPEVCAIGFEASPARKAKLDTIEKCYRNMKNWNVHFFVPYAISNTSGQFIKFYDRRGSKLESGHKDPAVSILRRKGYDVYDAETVDLLSILNQISYGAIVFMKMDIERSEFKVLPHLLANHALCDGTISQMTLEWHVWPTASEFPNRNAGNAEALKQMQIIFNGLKQQTCKDGVNHTLLSALNDESHKLDNQPCAYPNCTGQCYLDVWPQYGVDNSRCGTGAATVASQSECKQIAINAGHSYYSFSTSPRRCLSSAFCTSPTTGTIFPWKIYRQVPRPHTASPPPPLTTLPTVVAQQEQRNVSLVAFSAEVNGSTSSESTCTNRQHAYLLDCPRLPPPRVVLAFRGAYQRFSYGRCSNYFSSASNIRSMIINPLKQAGVQVSIIFVTYHATCDDALIANLQPTAYEFSARLPGIADGLIKALQLVQKTFQDPVATILLRFDVVYKAPISILNIDWRKVNIAFRDIPVVWSEAKLPEHVCSGGTECIMRKVSDLFFVIPWLHLEPFINALNTSGKWDPNFGSTHSAHHVYRPLRDTIGKEEVHFIDNESMISSQPAATASTFLRISRRCASKAEGKISCLET